MNGGEFNTIPGGEAEDKKMQDILPLRPHESDKCPVKVTPIHQFL